MPRVNRIKKARKSPGKCTRCGHKIKKGDPYLWWKFNFGAKYVRCSEPACYPKPSELTRSAFWGSIRDLEAEGFSGTTFEELTECRDRIVDGLNEVADDCEEKYNNMPESLQSGSTGELLQERADACRECASSLEAVNIPDEAPPELEEDDKGEDADDERKEYERRVDSTRDDLENALDLSCS